MQVAGSFARTGIPLPVSTTAYNSANELTQWGTANLFYDLNGNMTSKGTNSFVRNARNQLASMNASTISFAYDPFGRRVSKTISGATTNYLYDGVNPVQELSGGTPTANVLGGLAVDEHFLRTDASGPADFLTGPLGSTIALADSTGTVQTSYTYEPFGNASAVGTGSTNPYQYTGRENDATGLYYYRARYYSPMFGRFISQDPAGFAGGINLYGYAGDEPTDELDPTGLQPAGAPSPCPGASPMAGRKSRASGKPASDRNCGRPQKPPCQTSGPASFADLAVAVHEVEAPFLPVVVLSGFALGIGGQVAVGVGARLGTSGFACAVSLPVTAAGAAALGYGAYKYSRSLPGYYRDWWHEINQPGPSASACGG